MEPFFSLLQKRPLSDPLKKLFKEFFSAYLRTVTENNGSTESCNAIFSRYLELAERQLNRPYRFKPYHEMDREPFDYHQYGLDFIRPLVLFERSTVRGREALKRIQAQLAAGENAILFANHQTEPDPQIITLLLEEEGYPRLGEEMIFVAGHRVTTDPLAVPFSRGCNLLCIYSKKHVEHPPEEKETKLLHNKKTMLKMAELLSGGGKCIYMAPSGGRDRADENGKVEPSPFDPASVEMFRLMAKQSGTPTHFYPLALATYDLLPPPQKVEKELGEPRLPKRCPVHLYFGDEIEMERIPKAEGLGRRELREARSAHIFSLVNTLYSKLKESR